MPAANLDSLGDIAALLEALHPLPPRLLWELAWSILRAEPRSLAEDAQRVVARLSPPPTFEGLEMVPPRDPFLLVANHYQDPHLWIGWVAAAITAAVATVRETGSRNLHWVILAEWRWLEVGDWWLPNPISSLLFPRAARSWGLIPTPSRPSDVAGRARALRQVLTYLSRSRSAAHIAPEPVGLFPEGRASVALGVARPGTGAFLHRVSSLGVPLLPVAVHREGSLAVKFGRPFSLPDATVSDVDGWAGRQVMVAIGRMLPRELWGVYADAIEGTP